MKYIANVEDPESVTVTAGSNIDDIFIANPGAKNFYFETGNFYITDKLLIAFNYISFRSVTGNAKDVHIIQTNPAKDGIVLNNCGYTTITGISIHNEFSGRVALVAANIFRTSVNRCYIYGNDTTFTVYYAGPKYINAGVETLNAYTDNSLDRYNIFRNNVVYSKWSGDNIAFCLQTKGTFASNIVRGGKVAIYMCKQVKVTGNIIYDSTSQGLYISFPSDNLIIKNNKIYECKDSGIKLANQAEHGSFTAYNYNISITKNYIYDAKNYAVEINYGDDINIYDNKFISTDIYGIYAYKSKNISIINNKISYFTVGVWFELTNNSTVTTNSFMSVYPSNGKNVVKGVASSDNKVVDNVVTGKVLYTLFPFDAVSMNNEITGNTVNNYYSYDDELAVMKQ